MPLEAFLGAWSKLHGGAAVTGPTRVWLRCCHRLAVPLAQRGVSPTGLTAAGVVLAFSALVPAGAGGGWVAVAAVLVLLSSVFDGLDGAVAVLTDRASARGAVLDSVADRICEVAFVGVLWSLGAEAWWCLGAWGSIWLLEYVRARAAAVGIPGIGPVTIGERPTRVIVVVMFALAAAVFPGSADAWATSGAVVLVVVGVVGCLHLLTGLRARTPEDPSIT